MMNGAMIFAQEIIYKSEIKIIHKYTNTKPTSKSTTAIAELSPNAYQKIMQDQMIYVGYQRCRVYDYLNMPRCWNCCAYGHVGQYYKKIDKPNCKYFAGNHESHSCQNKQNDQCVNCILANKRNKKLKIDSNHTAFDEINCHVYNFKLEMLIDSINYPIRPLLRNSI